MSYAAFKMMHAPTGIETCASGNITHSPADFTPVQIPPIQTDDFDTEWNHRAASHRTGPLPNLVVTAGNVVEVYAVSVQDEDGRSAAGGSAEVKRGGVMDGVSGARLELICHYKLHGNVESMSILSAGSDDHRRRDSIVLAFKDSKISVLEYDDLVCGLRTSSMHSFEGPEWNYLKRGRESFAYGPAVKTDPQGRCAAVLVYDLQMIILKASQTGQVFAGEDEASGRRGTCANCVESSYIINLRELDMKHVKDFTFVHGYIEPVMVLLHEVELTWAGRLSWKHHTCMISAHSISTTLKQQPLIWSASNIPHDAFKLFAVPSPIGGVLVICANSVHYHSQSSSCALGVNSFFASADGSSDIQRTNFSVELDAANMAWLSHDVLMLSTKNGELLLLTLVYDGRMVHRLDLSRSKASVLTSGITTIGNRFFFLASRLGDSLLVQYNCGTSIPSPFHDKEEVVDIEGDGPPMKRLRRLSSDALDNASTEELSLYSSVDNTSELTQKNFSFSVRDSLVNIGPLKDFSYGLRINADPNAVGIAKQSNYELVCCSGHGKNGALCILQKSIRPELITEVELPGCRGIWTVYHKSSRSHATDSKIITADDEYHAYLIISLESRTMVLETADLLGEVTESVDYYVQGSTVAAGNLFGRRRVIQVFARGARILDGSYMTQELLFGGHSSDISSNAESLTVASVSIADPHVLLRMSDGSIQLLVGDPSSSTVTVSIPVLSGSSSEPISACTLYHDKGPEPWLRKASTDAWLSSGIADIDSSDGGIHDQGDVYCLVCYEGGTLEIFDVPNFKCVYTLKKFLSGKRHLMDAYVHEPSLSSSKDAMHGKVPGQVNNEHVQSMKIIDVAMQRWSGHTSRPFLFALLNDGTMLCYHAFLYEAQDNMMKIDDSASSQNSVDPSGISRFRNLRFVRVPLDGYLHDDSGGANAQRKFTIFKNVGGYQGLFVAGSRPTWFMVCRERLRIHPQLCDGSISAFAVLHNVNCNHGLIYVTSQGFLKICQLPSVANYDNYWPVQKIPLRGTPHQITYFAERNLYPVIVSVPVDKPLNQVISSVADQEASHQLEHDNSSYNGQQKYTTDEFEVRILEQEKSTYRWETRSTISMQVSEHALTIRMVSLLNSESKENETLLAIGTAYVQGEDVAGRGRVLLFSFGKNSENSQYLVSEVYSKELKGAISALSSLQGRLLVASGPKITLYKWTGNELTGVAFFDAPPLHAVSMNIVKNFILLGDVHKSIYFLNWKEQGAQLSLLAKDFGSLDCYATEFLIDGSTLSLVVSDDEKNIQIFFYAPKMSESWKGQKLLTRAEFHAGAHVSKFMRLQMLPVTTDRSNPASGSEKTNRFALLFGTLDGSVGCIAPLDELTFRRVQTLQRKLVDAVPHVCGLNPRGFRRFRSCGKPHRPGPDNMVDFELLCHYEMLPLEEQLEIAHQIGTTRGQILSNLNDLSLGISFL